jgi:hypothetical protein
MGELFLILFWSGPIGIGLFLALLGVFIWLLAKADEISKRTKAFAQEKGLEKKKE